MYYRTLMYTQLVHVQYIIPDLSCACTPRDRGCLPSFSYSWSSTDHSGRSLVYTNSTQLLLDTPLLSLWWLWSLSLFYLEANVTCLSTEDDEPAGLPCWMLGNVLIFVLISIAPWSGLRFQFPVNWKVIWFWNILFCQFLSSIMNLLWCTSSVIDSELLA